MGEGYQVVLGDLKAAASTFAAEAVALQKLQPEIQPAPVVSGDAGLDATLAALLGTFGVYGTALTGAIRDHGTKLEQCHDNYHQNDSDVVELYNTVMSQLGG